MLTSTINLNSQIYYKQGHYQIVQLTEEVIHLYIKCFVDLEHKTLSELGDRYANQQWTEQHYLRDLPGKWKYSLCALDTTYNCIVGFLITSLWENNLHLHRILVDSDFRGYISDSEGGVFSLSERFYSILFKKAFEDHLEYFTAEVSYGNKIVRDTYLRHGYELLDEKEKLLWFIQGKKLNAQACEDHIFVEGDKNFVVRKKISEAIEYKQKYAS
ncbi:MAG: hypothetical protein HQM12_00125 [SAR324 cluster bacterium]|nr:hypothetical protein [SAR324 cluster bacterium]